MIWFMVFWSLKQKVGVVWSDVDNPQTAATTRALTVVREGLIFFVSLIH